MNSVIAWFAHNRVAANLLMVLILVSGIFAIQTTKKTVLPDLDLDIIMVTVPYPGASPLEVEEGVVWRIETNLASMPSVDSIESFAHENRAVFIITVGFGYEANQVNEQIRTRLATISGLPKHVERPIVQRLAIEREPVASVVISGPADRLALNAMAREVRDDLLELPEITQVDIPHELKAEISIEVSEFAMQRYGLSFSELAGAIKQQSVNISAGMIDSPVGKTSIRTVGQAYNVAQYEELVVRTLPNGGRVLLKDVANVQDRLEESESRLAFNGEPAIFVNVYRSGKQSILNIAEAIRGYVANPKIYLPESIKMDISQDVSYYFKSRVELLVENGAVGLALLFFILMLFLRTKLSFWISVGIPVSFMGAFCVLLLLDDSFNMVSLFAFILVLGIVVDDAIIVGENIFSHIRKGNSGVKGAILGAQEVAKPVIFAVITTMLMFVPLLFLPGPEGQLMQVIPVVVIAILAFSLIESLLILPAHLSTVKAVEKAKLDPFSRIQSAFSRAMEYFVDVYFRPFTSVAVRWRYPVSLFFLVLFLLTAFLLSSSWIKFVLFSTIEADYSVATISFPQGTPKERMEEAVDYLELKAEMLRKRLHLEFGSDQLKAVVSKYGVSGQEVGDHLGSVVLELTPSENRKISGEQLNDRWRTLVGTVSDATQLTFDSTLNKPGPAIDYELTGLDFETLEAASDSLKGYLTQFNGVYGITDSMERGNPELKLHLNPLAHDIGLQAADVANQVRQAFYGVEIQRLQRGRDDIRVVLRYPEDQRKSLWYLENMQVRLPSGESVPLNMIAELEYSRGPAKIRHIDQRRSIRVQAYVDESLNNAKRITDSIQDHFFPVVKERYPDIQWYLGGVQKHSKMLIDYLFMSVSLALIVMYILMAILFRSYSQPLIVMYAIPFGMVGAVLGHILVGVDITLWSFIGMAAVSGVVVNDNLVLVDYINRRRALGYRLKRSIREACAARFRPIVLTSMTTFFGLVPLMMEKSVQAQFLVPMAVALSFGVLFATVVSLILVPVTYHILDDILEKFGLGTRYGPLLEASRKKRSSRPKQFIGHKGKKVKRKKKYRGLPAQS